MHRKPSPIELFTNFGALSLRVCHCCDSYKVFLNACRILPAQCACLPMIMCGMFCVRDPEWCIGPFHARTCTDMAIPSGQAQVLPSRSLYMLFSQERYEASTYPSSGSATATPKRHSWCDSFTVRTAQAPPSLSRIWVGSLALERLLSACHLLPAPIVIYFGNHGRSFLGKKTRMTHQPIKRSQARP